MFLEAGVSSIVRVSDIQQLAVFGSQDGWWIFVWFYVMAL